MVQDGEQGECICRGTKGSGQPVELTRRLAHRLLHHRLVAMALSSWRMHAQEGAELRRRAALLVATLQQRLLRSAWNAWVERGRLKQAAAQLVQRALASRVARSLGACFTAWRSTASERARQTWLLQQALGRLVQHQLSAAFAQWRAAAGLRLRNRQLVDAAVSRLGGRRLADCFSGWRQWAGQKRRFAGIQHAAGNERRRRQLDACFGLWRATAHRQATALRCLAAIRLRHVRAAFSTWQAAVEDSRAEAALAALAPKQLQRAFLQWRAALLLAQQKRQRVEKAAAWAFGSSRQRAWKAWALYDARQRKKRAAQERFRAGMVRRCLAAWQERLVAKQRLLVKQEHLQAVAARRLVGAALTEWRWAAAVAAFLRRYYCARAWAAWSEKAAAAKVGLELCL